MAPLKISENNNRSPSQAPEKKEVSLRIAAFLNNEYYSGYYHSDPIALTDYLEKVSNILGQANIKHHIHIISKDWGSTTRFRHSLLCQMDINPENISTYERNNFSESDPSWFNEFDFSLFTAHGSINLECALAGLPCYLFLLDSTPISLAGNYCSADISPRIILRSDLPRLKDLLCLDQLQIEAERQFEYALNQVDLLRAEAPSLIRLSQFSALNIQPTEQSNHD